MGLVESRALSQQVDDILMEWIAGSRLKPGERLKETQLAEELGVSRTPIREALKSLAANGFVRIVPRKGVFVSEISTRTLKEILELRYLFEMYAAERGIERISPKDLREMRSLIKGCESIVNSSDRLEYHRYVQKDCDLHRLIIRSGDNSLLIQPYERLAVFLQITRVRLFESMPSMVVGHREHEAMLRAYERRDKERLLEVLGSHLRRSTNEILEVASRMME